MAAAKRSVLSSLAVYAEDSDPESDSEAGTGGSDGGTATGEGREGTGEGSGPRGAATFPFRESKAALVAAWPFLMVFLFPSSLGEKGGLVSVAYGDDDFTRLEGDEDGYEEEDDENSRQSVSISLRRELALIPLACCRGFSLSKGNPRVATRDGTWNI